MFTISDDAILPFDAIITKTRNSKSKRRRSSKDSFNNKRQDKKRKLFFEDNFMMEEEEEKVKKELNADDEFADDNNFFDNFSVKMDHESLAKLVPDQDNKYKCPLCKAKFKDKEVLGKHFASHKFCHKCGKSTKCDRDFLRHVKKCGKSPHTCSLCGVEFPYKSYLVRHQEKSKCKQTAEINAQNAATFLSSTADNKHKFHEVESGDDEENSVKSETFDDIAAEINNASHATSHQNITDNANNSSDYIDHVTGLVSGHNQTIVLNNSALLLPPTNDSSILFQSNLKSKNQNNTFPNNCDATSKISNIQAENSTSNTIFEPNIKME